MSWSVGAVGKTPAVRAYVEKQFADAHPCAEPEESVRQAARAAIAAALSAQRYDSVVQISASGSMSQTYNQETKTYGPPTSNNLDLKVQSFIGFVE